MVARNMIEIVRLLLPYVDVNKRGKSGKTLLHSAAELGYLDIVELLLKYGADRSLTDVYGRTALNLAQWEGHTEVVGLLQDAANIDHSDSRDWMGCFLKCWQLILAWLKGLFASKVEKSPTSEPSSDSRSDNSEPLGLQGLFSSPQVGEIPASGPSDDDVGDRYACKM